MPAGETSLQFHVKATDSFPIFFSPFFLPSLKCDKLSFMTFHFLSSLLQLCLDPSLIFKNWCLLYPQCGSKVDGSIIQMFISVYCSLQTQNLHQHWNLLFKDILFLLLFRCREAHWFLPLVVHHLLHHTTRLSIQIWQLLNRKHAQWGRSRKIHTCQ